MVKKARAGATAILWLLQNVTYRFVFAAHTVSEIAESASDGNIVSGSDASDRVPASSGLQRRREKESAVVGLNAITSVSFSAPT